VKRIRSFDYYKPGSLPEAIEALARYGGEAIVLAGGTDLVVSMKMKGISPRAVINLKGISGLSSIQEGGGVLKIGTLSTIHSMILSPLLSSLPLVKGACGVLGTPQVRNLATIGGNICNASPAGDLIPPLLALDAVLKIDGPSGQRLMKITDFFRGPGVTELGLYEILTEINITLANSVGLYLKHGIRMAHDLSVVSIAACLNIQEDLTVSKARLALGAVAPTPFRAMIAEGLLVGQRLSDKVIREVARQAMEEANPITDVRASANYRKEMVGVLTDRVLRKILQTYRQKSGEKKNVER
jgi:carbon-monoxide dehydrogenase medium subunit